MDVHVKNMPASAALCQNCGRPIVAPDQPVITSLGWYHAECARSPHKQVATLTKCGECVFWECEDTFLSAGLCHAHPPTPKGKWPMTRAVDYCGDGVAHPQTGPSEEEEKTDV